MALQPMYAAVNGSMPTTITEALTATASTIPVADASVFPPPPGIATIGGEDGTELITYTGKTETSLTGVLRGVHGTMAQIWPADTLIFRGYTSYDHDTFVNNITDLDSRKVDGTGNGSDVTVAFAQAGTRANIASGTKLSVIFGLISKWFADFKAGAWADFGTANNQIARGDHTHGYGAITGTPSLAAVATSGAYNDLSGKPTIPTTAADVSAVPTARTVNNKALSANISLTAADVSAAIPAKSALLTLLASGWSGNTQSLTNANILAASPGSLRIAQSATPEQYAAFGTAQPQVVAQSAGSITVRANGAVPTINIPLELEVRS